MSRFWFSHRELSAEVSVRWISGVISYFFLVSGSPNINIGSWTASLAKLVLIHSPNEISKKLADFYPTFLKSRFAGCWQHASVVYNRLHTAVCLIHLPSAICLSTVLFRRAGEKHVHACPQGTGHTGVDTRSHHLLGAIYLLGP